MTTHHIDSPSSLARRRLCPGSRRLEAEFVGEDTGSDASRSGTHTHTLIEMCVAEDFKDPALLVGETYKDHDGEFTVDIDRATRANIMVQYLKRRREELGKQVAVRVEQKVDPGRLMRRDNMGGTADAIVVGNDTLEVVDYKDGYVYVNPVNNDQALGYLIGALVDYLPRLDMRTAPFKRFITTIVQPRNIDSGEAEGEPVGSHEYSLDDLLAWVRDVDLDLQKADAPDAPAIPGEKQCMFCDARGVCAERAKKALEGVTFPVVSPDAGLDEQVGAMEQLAGLDVEKLTHEQIISFLDGADIMRSVLKAVEEHALRLARQGVQFGDRVLKETLGNRTWTLPPGEVAKKLKNRRLNEADIYDKKLRSPTQILKNSKLDAKQKARIEKDLVHRPVSGAKLVLPEVKGTAVQAAVPAGVFPNTSIPEDTTTTPDFMRPPTQTEETNV